MKEQLWYRLVDNRVLSDESLFFSDAYFLGLQLRQFHSHNYMIDFVNDEIVLVEKDYPHTIRPMQYLVAKENL